MIQEFKAFIARGNVLDLAVGVIIGFGPEFTDQLVEAMTQAMNSQDPAMLPDPAALRTIVPAHPRDGQAWEQGTAPASGAVLFCRARRGNSRSIHT